MAIGLLTAGSSPTDESGSFAQDVADTVNAVYNRVYRPRRAACAGVSFMAQQTQNGPSNFLFGSIGSLTHFFALAGWPYRWDFASNFAVGGTTTALVLQTQVPAVLASHATDPIEIIFIAMGTNDHGAGVTYEQSIQNMDQIISALTNAGIKVVIESITPRGIDGSMTTGKRFNMRLNKWLELQGIRGRIEYIDITAALADTSTSFGNALPALTYDPASALHPNTRGARLIGNIYFNYFKDRYLPTPTITYVTQPADIYHATENPQGCLFDNPFLQGGTTAPTGYTTSGGTWAGSNVTLPNGQIKRVWTVPLIASTNHFFYRDLLRGGSGWQPADRVKPGDRLEARARITVTNATGLRNVLLMLAENNGSGQLTYRCLTDATVNEVSSMDGTYTYDLKTPICTVRPYNGSGDCSVFVRAQFITESSGVAGTATVESFEMRKVID